MAPSTNTRVLRAKHIAKDEAFSKDDLKIVHVEFDATLNEGEILVRNLYLSLDPYTRFSFEKDGDRAAAPLDTVVSGFGVAEVIASKSSAFPVSSIVLGSTIGWEQYSRHSNLQGFFIIPDAHNPKIALANYLNILGMNGLTAFAAVDSLVKFHKDQVVYVPSAAGPVGSFLCFLAKRDGAFVIGSAGSEEKIQYLLRDIGVDYAFNYKTQDSRAELYKAASEGVDIYFDLVGGETLDIAIEKLKSEGQIITIGNISQSGAAPYVMKNWSQFIFKSLRMNGFTVFKHLDKFPRLWKEIGPLVAEGKFKSQQLTIVKGVERTSSVYQDYLDGKYFGKVVIEVAALQEE
ncbi:hypothetical protein EMPS_01771 [Entomortierella parvispora]|uniref:Enoyl reductase (ER) domain-containing protein n=1 Tax=Entomortierella parvispora TaxID=205924 RepID=A0A9P3H3P4_9FUNG|nr:hypothetical protein EMPS_01771 [Entomortierella parvispora]